MKKIINDVAAVEDEMIRGACTIGTTKIAQARVWECRCQGAEKDWSRCTGQRWR